MAFRFVLHISINSIQNFCHNITLVFKFDTRFQVLYKYTFKVFQNTYNCTVLVALISHILVQICSSVLLCQIKYDCHVRNFYSKIQDKWSRLCFILPHIQTIFSTFVWRKVEYTIWGERENDLHFANKAVYFRRFA